MYSRKSVGPRMDPWGTPALTRCFCENFPSRTTRSHLLLRQEVRPNIWPGIPQDLRLWRRPAFQTQSKVLDIWSATVLDIWSATAWVAPDLLKALAIVSERTVRRSAVDWECLKLYGNLEKRPYFFKVINSPIIYKFLKDFINHRKETNRVVVFSSRPFPNILKYRDHGWDLPTVWKTRLFQTHWRVQLVYMNVRPHSSLEPPLDYNQDLTPLMSQGSSWPF